MKQLLLSFFISLIVPSLAQNKSAAPKKPVPKPASINLTFTVKNSKGEPLETISIHDRPDLGFTDSSGTIHAKGLKKGDTLIFHKSHLHEEIDYFPHEYDIYREHRFVVPANLEAKVYEIVLEDVAIVPAQFPGGEKAMYQWISKQINYPEMALEQMIQGTCQVRIHVEKDGSVSEIYVIKGVPDCRACDQEVIRVLKKMPAWTPGTYDGERHDFYFKIPVIFKLS